jgi:hypothetical protein
MHPTLSYVQLLMSSSVYQGHRKSESFNSVKHNVCFVFYDILTTFWIHRIYVNMDRYVCESNKQSYKYMWLRDIG